MQRVWSLAGGRPTHGLGTIAVVQPPNGAAAPTTGVQGTQTLPASAGPAPSRAHPMTAADGAELTHPTQQPSRGASLRDRSPGRRPCPFSWPAVKGFYGFLMLPAHGRERQNTSCPRTKGNSIRTVLPRSRRNVHRLRKPTAARDAGTAPPQAPRLACESLGGMRSEASTITSAQVVGDTTTIERCEG
jgi:hypothetical protein